MKRSMMAGFALCAFGAFGAIRTNTLEKTATDWTLPESYVDKSFVPGDGDVVIVPSKSELTVAVPSASFTLLNKLSQILLADDSTTLILSVAQGADETLKPGLRSVLNGYYGTVVKAGPGALTLGDGSTFSSTADVHYFTGFRVVAGLFRFAQNTPSCFNSVYHGPTYVGPDATLMLHGGGFLYSAVTALTGSGRVTTPDATKLTQFRVIDKDKASLAKSGEFSGALENKINLYVSGRLMLTGDASTFANTTVTTFGTGSNFVSGAGTLGIKDIGLKTDTASSIGTATKMNHDSTGGAFMFIGGKDGMETTDKSWAWRYAANCVSAFDGGPYGNLTFTGEWLGGNDGEANLFLVGTNRNEVVMDGKIKIAELHADQVRYPIYITKAGSGAWRFTAREGGLNTTVRRQNDGVFAVEEGSLRFDSLEDAGFACSLGLATNLVANVGLNPKTRADAAAQYAANRVPYAFLLGATKADSLYGRDGEGTLEYVNDRATSVFTGGVYCATRQIALKGDGRLKNVSGSRMTLRDVVSYGANAKRLTLEGTGSVTNYLADVNDAAGGKISVVKEGADTWVLTGTNAIRGDITVKAGTLILENINGRQYAWHKWIIRDTWSSVYDPYSEVLYPNGKHYQSDTRYAFRVDRFGLFDAQGNCLNEGLSVADDFAQLEPGQAAFSTMHRRYGTVSSAQHLNRWFLTGSANLGQSHYFYKNLKLQCAHEQNAADPSSWRSVTMRLKAGSNPAVSWDFANVYAVNTMPEVNKGFCIRAATLLASANGVNWEQIARSEDLPLQSAERCWTFDGRASDIATHTNCNVIASSVQGSYPFLPNVGAVSVASGAVLEAKGEVEISQVAIDAKSGGTIKGVKLAENGTLTVSNFDGKGTVELPLVFSETEDFQNVTKWTLRIGDKVVQNKDIRANAATGKIEIVPHGLLLIVR